MDRHDAALLEGDEELALVIRLMLSSERDEEEYLLWTACRRVEIFDVPVADAKGPYDKWAMDNPVAQK